ncbi:MAG: flagellar biosynthesis protein FlhA [Gammaproteobacteria bacterium]|jgi:flagellar biosynthesis protein FlhA|nr:flagellar biosynthesis protein FlhA [Gammaproteobacteria bacterium]MBT3489889.1 flagellar biosynthesis protein FlhA [Gammaproteobacteria bacterium]MBT3719252.1 flagellar biosynthesis protein FlhA [Gammaproteobacteria bacterium]MBT3846046.1 flagellar biosynthesis protein FlhA [Gammaproteobacteria bacterium]MBT3893534.1 flagellar biosynthesis protein FlhA [Gammaproteobacteria bacterium]
MDLEQLKRIITQALGAPLMLVMIMAMLIIPLAPWALDIFFTFNIALALIVLMTAVYAMRPLDFSVFPTIILISTLMRLALNVASTRVILMEGHSGGAAAGNVIEAFGSFVIGGNFAVGLVVFMILVIINFVVITKGAGRVSEVSARFTLDAMPGKQMAIDADLNSGLIDQDEAKQRRVDVAREAEFYGSMDGASKFVRGDAVAGILILFINIVGGFIIGMAQHDLSAAQAAENYIVLTVGDGLVAQIPALVLSTATAIVVTRVSDASDLGGQIFGQLFAKPQTLIVAASIIGLLGIIPGMPNFAFLTLASILGGAAYMISMKNQEQKVEEAAATEVAADEMEVPRERDVGWDDVETVDPLTLEVGYRLIPMVDTNQGGELIDRIKGIRRKLSKELGFLVHAVHIKDNLDLVPTAYRVQLMGVPVGEGELVPDHYLAINPGQVFGELEGKQTKDPTFGMDAVWIDSDHQEHAQSMGYTVVDASTVVATHLSDIVRSHASELIGVDEVKELLERLSESAPKLVEDLVPKTVEWVVVLKVLQNLLEEAVSIRDMRTIAETLAEHAPKGQDPDALTMAVRNALGRSIVQELAGIAGELPVITLDPNLEQILHQSVQGGGTGGSALEPGLAEQMNQSLLDAVQQQEVEGQPAVLLVAPTIRRLLARMFRHSLPDLTVLSYTEVPDDRSIRMVANVGGQG